MAPLPPRLRPPRPQGLSLGTFNICNGRGSGLFQAIRAVQIGGFDLTVLTETKIMDQAYCCNRLGYNLVFLPEITTAAGGAQGEVGLVFREQPEGWITDLMKFLELNVVSCEFVTGGQRTPLIGAYLPTSTL